MAVTSTCKKPSYEKWAITFACAIGLILMAIGNAISPAVDGSTETNLVDSASYQTGLSPTMSPPP